MSTLWTIKLYSILFFYSMCETQETSREERKRQMHTTLFSLFFLQKVSNVVLIYPEVNCTKVRVSLLQNIFTEVKLESTCPKELLDEK